MTESSGVRPTTATPSSWRRVDVPRRENLIYAQKDAIDQSLPNRALVVALALAVRRVHTSEAGGEGLLHEFGRSVALVRRRVDQLGHLDERAVRRRHFEKWSHMTPRRPPRDVVQVDSVDGE